MIPKVEIGRSEIGWSCRPDCPFYPVYRFGIEREKKLLPFFVAIDRGVIVHKPHILSRCQWYILRQLIIQLLYLANKAVVIICLWELAAWLDFRSTRRSFILVIICWPNWESSSMRLITVSLLVRLISLLAASRRAHWCFLTLLCIQTESLACIYYTKYENVEEQYRCQGWEELWHAE
jgi:hypothetical protein